MIDSSLSSQFSVLSSSHTVLITGGTGFAGSHLVEELLAQGYQNIYVTNYSPEETYVHTLIPADHIIRVDLTDKQATFEMIEKIKPQWIFHLASIAIVGGSFQKAAAIFQNNTLLQFNILEAVKSFVPDARMLVIGSGMEYGVYDHPIDELQLLHPINPYAVSKATQDLLAISYVYSYGLDVVVARPFNHIGERQTLDFAVPAFASQIAEIEKGKQAVIKVGNLEAVRDLSDVKDIVKAYIILLQKGVKGEVYNIGSGVGYSMQEILDKLVSLSQQKITVEQDPERMRPSDVPLLVAHIGKIEALGWKPTQTIDETLQRVMEEWRGKGKTEN